MSSNNSNQQMQHALCSGVDFIHQPDHRFAIRPLLTFPEEIDNNNNNNKVSPQNGQSTSQALSEGGSATSAKNKGAQSRDGAAPKKAPTKKGKEKDVCGGGGKRKAPTKKKTPANGNSGKRKTPSQQTKRSNIGTSFTIKQTADRTTKKCKSATNTSENNVSKQAQRDELIAIRINKCIVRF